MPVLQNNKILITGLGNPGSQYQNTRHNVGFLVLNALAAKIGVSFSHKGDSAIASFLLDKKQVILLKPQTYMNLSGKSVASIVSFYKIPAENIVVIHDDLDLKIGAYKIKIGGSSGGHNGLKSIDSFISNQYWRFRIGIGRPPVKEDIVSYVLGVFSSEDLEQIENIAQKTAENLSELIGENKQKFIFKMRGAGANEH